MEKENLIALVRKSQAGDPEAIEQLLSYAHTSVSYQCRKMMKSQQDAEDMTQEVLLTIYRKLDTLQEPAAFHKWVNQIAASRCINTLSRTHVEYQFAQDEEGHSILDTLEELDEQAIPDKAIDNAETARMIEEIVSQLPDAQRAATLMFYYGEMSVKEIAHTMQVSENTIKSRLNYARKAIKEKVLDYEKQGIKLYGLSPLPFLLYFLRMAARSSENKDAAAVVVRKVMSAGGAAAVAAGAGGTAAAAGSAAGAGALTGIAVKIAAGVLAAAVTIGTIAAVVIPQEEKAPVESDPVATVSTDIPETEQTTSATEVSAEPTEEQPTEPAAEPAETEPQQAPTEPETIPQPPQENLCSACGIGQIVPVDMTQDPCATKLEVAFRCSHCGVIAGYSYPPGNGHTIGISDDGMYEICTVCGHILGPTGIGHGGVTDTTPIETEPPAVVPHTCDYVITELVDRSCTVAGYAVATCTICGDVHTQYLNAQGHFFTDGICSVCGQAESAG